MNCERCGKRRAAVWWTPIGELCIPCLVAENYTLDLTNPGVRTPLPDGTMRLLEEPR
jgi:hypothetical protein